MKYTKSTLSHDAQSNLLIARGMIGDRELMKARLAAVNYYRLSGYWYPFRRPDDSFAPGTTFDTVWDRYVFDRRLRLLTMDAIERIEISVRSQLAYHHAHAHGPFGYATDQASMPKLNAANFRRFVEHVEEEKARSRETFVEHFSKKYGSDHEQLPVWMATEVMSFGTVLTFFRGSSSQVKRSVAAAFGMPHTVFDSWLLTLNTIRNICAHHSRLWNRILGVKPLIPRVAQYPHWHHPVAVSNNRMFAALTICQHCLRQIAPQSHWAGRVRSLLCSLPAIPWSDMGFPPNWQQCPIWV